MHSFHTINCRLKCSTDGYIELEVELIFDELMDEPTLPEPFGAVFVGLQTEPVVVIILVLLDILFVQNRCNP